MAQSRFNPNISNPKVLIGLSVLLIVIGRMVINPAVGFICSAMAAIILIAAVFKGKRLTRYIALFLLIVNVVLTLSAYFKVSKHFETYKTKLVKYRRTKIS